MPAPSTDPRDQEVDAARARPRPSATVDVVIRSTPTAEARVGLSA